MLSAPWPAATADSAAAGLSRCASIANADARLACYDTLAGRTAAVAPVVAAPAAVAVAPAASPVTVSPAPPAAASPAPPAPSAASASPAPPAPTTPAGTAAAAENFGFSSAQLHTEPTGPKSIQAHVASVTADQSMRNFVVLDNGQTWLSTDGEFQLEDGELVTIRRAALGSFMLASTQSKHSYHVRRVR
jgi:hypothetical protein